ncbi:NAD(P)H-binding protein [Amycolatopsis sp. NPDC051102]|uniref:NAD(P)-dependent oxidoreductase n=1 Tax=Amycolatopsis sp. NPDC051102 TaxID=3155163 RepID=UPI003419C8DD
MPGPENHDAAQLRLFCRLMLGSADAADRVLRQIHRRAPDGPDEHPSDRARLFRMAADLCGVRRPGPKRRIMHIGVIGATGTVGSRIVTEALDRGHQVTAFSRDASGIEDGRENIRWKNLDATDSGAIAGILPRLDVLISGSGAGNAAKDPTEPGIHAREAAALLTALEGRLRVRLIVVGGAASLEARPGVVFAGSDELLDAAVLRGHDEALNLFRASDRLWTYLSPAGEIAPGERTGRFRIGGDQPVTDAGGRSRISAEDAAVAVLDEVELPRFVQRRFTIGY